MSDPRESLFAAVALKLESITIPNGYAVDVDKIYRVDVVPDEMPSTVKRALLVLESLSPETWEYLDNGASGGYMVTTNMTIAGVVRGGMTDGKSSDRATDTNHLMMATVKALMADRGFSSTAKNSWIMNPIVFIDTDKAEGLFNLTLRCIYAFDYGDL
jgi:hypothetical protein